VYTVVIVVVVVVVVVAVIVVLGRTGTFAVDVVVSLCGRVGGGSCVVAVLVVWPCCC
jgi:hypothetical protein